MREPRCKKCRRVGQKLFLKGEKCFSPHCPLLRRPYPPGQRGKRPSSRPSDYAQELLEKQKIRHWYQLREKQFSRYVKEVFKKAGQSKDAGAVLIGRLEKRLDNVVFKLGLARSRAQARQLVSHGHILVNDKPINIPSFEVKVGDTIKVKPSKKEKGIFKEISISLKDYQPPSWLTLDKKEMAGKVKSEPTMEEAGVPAETSAVFEYYSR